MAALTVAQVRAKWAPKMKPGETPGSVTMTWEDYHAMVREEQAVPDYATVQRLQFEAGEARRQVLDAQQVERWARADMLRRLG